MRFLSLRFIPLLLVFGLAACDSNDVSSFDIDVYTGAAYTGPLVIETTPPAGGVVTVEHNASLTITDLGNGRARVELDTDSNEGDPLVFEGTYTESGAQVTLGSGTNAAVFGVSPSGRVTGGGEITFFDTVLDISVSGNATASRINLVLEAEILVGNEEVPAGTDVTISLNLTR